MVDPALQELAERPLGMSEEYVIGEAAELVKRISKPWLPCGKRSANSREERALRKAFREQQGGASPAESVPRTANRLRVGRRSCWRSTRVHPIMTAGRCHACGQPLPEAARKDPPLPPLDFPAIVTIHDLPPGTKAEIEVITGRSGTHTYRLKDRAA